MSKQSLSANQIIQLRQGLEMRIVELEKRIDNCKSIDMPGLAGIYQKDLDDTTAMQKVLNACYMVTLE